MGNVFDGVIAVPNGVRLFGVPSVRRSLKTLDVSASSQLVNLRFEVKK